MFNILVFPIWCFAFSVPSFIVLDLVFEVFNDTQREKLCFIQLSTRNGWLATSGLFDMFTQSIKFYYTLY